MNGGSETHDVRVGEGARVTVGVRVPGGNERGGVGGGVADGVGGALGDRVGDIVATGVRVTGHPATAFLTPRTSAATTSAG
jgi:hypothetical protein